MVISDIDTLKSLSSREIICGYAEILKSSLIANYKNFKFLSDNLNSIINIQQPYIGKAILNSCNLKKKIVQKDEVEKEKDSNWKLDCSGELKTAQVTNCPSRSTTFQNLRETHDMVS